jgi:hypothetical protein
MYNTRPIQTSHPANWDQLYIDLPANLTLNTSIPVLNNDYSQPPLVSGHMNPYTGMSTMGTQLSPAPSDNALSPLFPTSPHLSGPSTPSSTYHGSLSSPAQSKDSHLASVDNQGPSDAKVFPAVFPIDYLLIIRPHFQTDKNLYTHREQLVLFRDAFKLPLDGAGPFIPQQMYKPHTTSDRKRYVEEVLLEAPLYFYSSDPAGCGILLKDALHSRTRKLHNRDQAVFEGRGPSVSIRFEVRILLGPCRPVLNPPLVARLQTMEQANPY